MEQKKWLKAISNDIKFLQLSIRSAASHVLLLFSRERVYVHVLYQHIIYKTSCTLYTRMRAIKERRASSQPPSRQQHTETHSHEWSHLKIQSHASRVCRLRISRNASPGSFQGRRC